MVDKKRILWLIDHLGYGGAETLTVQYLRHLANGPFDLRVCVFMDRDGNPIGREIEKLGIPVDQVPIKLLRHPGNLPRLLRYLRQRKVDLVHTQLEFSNTLGNLAAGLLGIPSVSTLHTLDDPQMGDKAFRRLRVMWWSLRTFCNRVLAVSDEARRLYLRVSGDQSDHAVTAYNGIDFSQFQTLEKEDVSAKRRALGVPDDAALLTTVAVLRPQKGIQYMIEAMPAILDAVAHTYYLVVGSGEHEASLKERVATLGLKDHVVFAGFRQDVSEVLAASDVFVLPSLGDALPTVLAEAMASRLPIVATTVGGIPEMVVHERNGFLVDPANPEALAQSCIRILEDSILAKRMAAEGRKIVEERFNLQKQAEWLSAVYLDLLSGTSKR